MINNPQVPVVSNSELRSRERADAERSAGVFSRTAVATILAVAAVASLAVTSLINSNQQATAQSDVALAPAQSMPAAPLAVPLDSSEVRPFAFGYLVFENDPADGAPGFAPLPSGAAR